MVRYHTDRSLIEKIKTNSGFQKRILFAHGKETLLFPISERLTLAGFCVYRAQSGDAALDMIHQSNPDVVIADLYLNGVDGFNILSWVRRHYKKTAVFFTNSQIGKGDIRKMLSSNADGFFLEPLMQDLEEDFGTLILESLENFFDSKKSSSPFSFK